MADELNDRERLARGLDKIAGWVQRNARSKNLTDAQEVVDDLKTIGDELRQNAMPAVVSKSGDTEPIFAAARHDRSAPSADELDPVLGWLLGHGFAIQLPPARPLAIGDPVTTVEELDALPVGAVVRAGRTFRIGWRHVNGWSTSHGDDGRARSFLQDSIELADDDRLRVLDLPAAGSSS